MRFDKPKEDEQPPEQIKRLDLLGIEEVIAEAISAGWPGTYPIDYASARMWVEAYQERGGRMPYEWELLP
jgi:hypothetical protein